MYLKKSHPKYPSHHPNACYLPKSPLHYLLAGYGWQLCTVYLQDVGYNQYADPSSIYRASIWGIRKICLEFIYIYIFTKKQGFYFKQISHGGGYSGRGTQRLSFEHSSNGCLRAEGAYIHSFLEDSTTILLREENLHAAVSSPENSGIFTNWLARFLNHQQYYKRSFWVNIT